MEKCFEGWSCGGGEVSKYSLGFNIYAIFKNLFEVTLILD